MRQKLFKSAKRAVIKIGTSVLERSGDLDQKIVHALASDIARFRKRGVETVLVSSGAIAAGMRILKIRKRPAELKKLQALAAIGQRSLMQMYDAAFQREGIDTAQILLTWDDLGSKKRYENTRHTLRQILDYGALPIINENDTVATEEIQFGDNDQLSARVSILIHADLLLILSDSNGLYADYLLGESSRFSRVEEMDASVFGAVRDSKKNFSKGGMKSKLDAIQKAVEAGIPCVLADGKTKNLFGRLVKGEDLGTYFYPRK